MTIHAGLALGHRLVRELEVFDLIEKILVAAPAKVLLIGRQEILRFAAMGFVAARALFGDRLMDRNRPFDLLLEVLVAA